MSGKKNENLAPSSAVIIPVLNIVSETAEKFSLFFFFEWSMLATVHLIHSTSFGDLDCSLHGVHLFSEGP